MGFLKSTYTCKVRFYHDSDRETDVQWYFVDDDHHQMAEYHKFHTGNYADARILEWNGVGEVKGTKRYKRGRNVWNYEGKKGCMRGTREQFANGMSILDPIPPVPPCCAPLPRWLPLGGVVMGGKSETDYKLLFANEGGLRVGGIGVNKPTYIATTEGGAVFSGAASIKYTIPFASIGGAMMGGTTPAQQSITVGSTGGVRIGGEGEWTYGRTHDSEGGVEMGGETPSELSLSPESEGGVEMGGETPVEFIPAEAIPEVMGGEYHAWAATGSITLDLPAIATGDTWIVTVVNRDGGAVDLPVGWSSMASGSTPGLSWGYLTAYRENAGGDPLTVTVGSSTGTPDLAGASVGLSRAGSKTSHGWSDGTGTAISASGPSSAGPHALLLWWVFIGGVAGWAISPSGYGLAVDGEAGDAQYVWADEDQTISGPYGVTGDTDTSEDWASVLVVVEPE